MKIAVVIVNYNSGPLLLRCMDHLQRQTRPADSILVIDNASQDNSLAELAPDPTLTIHRLEENLGFAAANNFAFKQAADADYFITLNPDAFAGEDFIQALETAAEQNPLVSSFASRMMLDDTTVDGAGDTYHVSGLAWRNLHKQRYLPGEHQTREVFSPCAGAAMYRARDIIELGGFDESFFCYMEDVDLGYRMQLRAMRCLYIPEAVVQHLGSAVVNNYPGFAIYHGHRNLVWALLKNTPAALLPIVLTANLLVSALLGLVYLSRGEFRLYLQAKIDALRNLKQVWQNRKQVQSSRVVSNWQLLRCYNFGLSRRAGLLFGFGRG